MMTNDDHEGQIFLSYPHKIMDSFSCSPLVLFIYFKISEYAKMQFHMIVCLFVLILYVPSQQLWSLRDGQFT